MKQTIAFDSKEQRERELREAKRLIVGAWGYLGSYILWAIALIGIQSGGGLNEIGFIMWGASAILVVAFSAPQRAFLKYTGTSGFEHGLTTLVMSIFGCGGLIVFFFLLSFAYRVKREIEGAEIMADEAYQFSRTLPAETLAAGSSEQDSGRAEILASATSTGAHVAAELKSVGSSGDAKTEPPPEPPQDEAPSGDPAFQRVMQHLRRVEEEDSALLLSNLERLAALYERGMLTDEEFSEAKRRLRF